LLRWLAHVGCVLATALTVGLLAPAESLAIPPPAPPWPSDQSLAIVNGGVLWFDEESLILQGSHSGRQLGRAGGESENDFSSSATATAALVQEIESYGQHFVASVLPRRLSAIAQPPRLSGSGCTWWEPSAPYVVVEDDLVAVGECQEIREHPVREPLYIRNLRGGRWKVLRWLASAPEFAEEGPLLAIDTWRSKGRMTVSILEVSTGVTQASFEAPSGKLVFASPRRLVLQTPDRLAPKPPPRSGHLPAVSLRLYSSRGRYLANLGSASEPLISGMHIVTYENGTLSVRSVAGGTPHPIIGFNPPARDLDAVAFRWPELVVSETTHTPLLPSEVRCWGGSYGPPSKRLATFDLAQAQPFDPPPAIVHVEPAAPLTNCGPTPP
jgi:hypothetical protein